MKTKYLFFTGLLLLFSIFILHSCWDDSQSFQDDKATILREKNAKQSLESAQQWFEKNKPIKHTRRRRSLDSQENYYTLSLRGEPSWKYYAVTENDSLTVVDVDITDIVKQDFVTKESLESYKSSKDIKYRRSYSRFVHTKNKKNGQEIGFYMTIIPAESYIRNYNHRVRKNTYLHRDKFLSGYILFHELNGKFANGWKYQDGKIVGKIVLGNPSNDSLLNRSKLDLVKLPAHYEIKPILHKKRKRRDSSEFGDEPIELPPIEIESPVKLPPIEINPSPETPDEPEPYDPYIEDPIFGGGGGWYYPSFPPEIKNSTPCETEKRERKTADSLISKSSVQYQINRVLKIANDEKYSNNEFSFSFGINQDDKYVATHIIKGKEYNVDIGCCSDEINIEGAFHTHTPSSYNCFSPADIYTFFDANSKNGSFRYFYVLSKEATYLLTIVDEEMFTKFIQSHPKKEYIDSSNGWNRDKDIGDFSYKYLIKNNSDAAFEKIASFILYKYKTGLSLSKLAGKKFKPIFVEEVYKNGETTLKITTDCNLKK